MFKNYREESRRPWGANNWEVAQHWGIEQNAVSPRVSELLISGEVVDSHIRRPTGSGLMARVVIAAGHKRALIDELKAKAGNARDQTEQRYLLRIVEKLEDDEKRDAFPADWEAQIDENC